MGWASMSVIAMTPRIESEAPVPYFWPQRRQTLVLALRPSVRMPERRNPFKGREESIDEPFGIAAQVADVSAMGPPHHRSTAPKGRESRYRQGYSESGSRYMLTIPSTAPSNFADGRLGVDDAVPWPSVGTWQKSVPSKKAWRMNAERYIIDFPGVVGSHNISATTYARSHRHVLRERRGLHFRFPR